MSSIVRIGTSGSVALPSARLSRPLQLALERVAAVAVLAEATEQAREALTGNVLEGVAVLSVREAQYVAIVPTAEARLKSVVDAYAAAGARAVQLL